MSSRKRQKIESYFKVSSNSSILSIEKETVLDKNNDDTRRDEDNTNFTKTANAEPCMCPLCNEQKKSVRSVTYQPQEFDYTIKKDSNRFRTFQKKWFDDFKWISFCKNRKAAFCFICQWSNFHSSLKTTSDLAFISAGFTAWKRATETFRNHEKSTCHLITVMAMNMFKSPVNVHSILSDQHREEQIVRKKVFLKNYYICRIFGKTRSSSKGPR
jgi:hypothetical protein